MPLTFSYCLSQRRISGDTSLPNQINGSLSFVVEPIVPFQKLGNSCFIRDSSSTKPTKQTSTRSMNVELGYFLQSLNALSGLA
ncbi:MAG: hypothetical protein D6746_05020 [Bacteroidetes bacterium]|nr:MAG: hypothetical protein D6746_05020 [Bacteroidota bacterium]